MAFKLHVTAVQAVASGEALHRWLRQNGKYPAQGLDYSYHPDAYVTVQQKFKLNVRGIFLL